MWTWHVCMNCKDYFHVWKYIDVCFEEYKWLIPHAWIRRIQKRATLEKGKGWKGKPIPFSAFWLRSSVVSVLISLISDTWFIEPHDIKCIFLGGGPTHNSLLLGLSGVACALHYSTSLAHPKNTNTNTKWWIDCWIEIVLVTIESIWKIVCIEKGQSRIHLSISHPIRFDSMVKSRPHLICDFFLCWI